MTKILLTTIFLAILSTSIAEEPVITDAERVQRQEARSKVHSEKVIVAIKLFYGAVAKFGESDIVKDVLEINKLTDSLKLAVNKFEPPTVSEIENPIGVNATTMNESDEKEVVGKASTKLEEMNEADKERLAALKMGEELYESQQKLNEKINERAKVAIEVARKARKISQELIGINEQNKKSELVKQSVLSLSKRAKFGGTSHANINQLASTAAASELFICKNASDVECVSYHLMVAANAIYMASQIRETNNSKDNISDIPITVDDSDIKQDQQYKSMVEVTRTKEEIARSLSVKYQSGQVYREMVEKVNHIAQIELLVKEARVKASKSQYKKAKKNVRDVVNSMGLSRVLKEIVKSKISRTIHKINKYSHCSNVKKSCRKKLKLSKAELKEAKKVFKMLALIGQYCQKEQVKAIKHLHEANKEKKAAKIHSNMRCVPPSAPKADNPPEVTTDTSQVLFLHWSKFMIHAFTTSAMASDDTSTQTNSSNEIYEYYEFRKVEEADVLNEAYPTPETRYKYMKDISLNMADSSSSQIRDTFSKLVHEVSQVNAILVNHDNLNNDAVGAEESQPAPATSEAALTKRKILFGLGATGISSAKNVTNATSIKSGNNSTGDLLSIVGPDRKALSLVKEVNDDHDKANELLKKLGYSIKSGPGRKDAWNQHNKRILSKFASKHPGNKSYAQASLGRLNSISAEAAKESSKTPAKAIKELTLAGEIGESKNVDWSTKGMLSDFDTSLDSPIDSALSGHETDSNACSDPKSEACRQLSDTLKGRDALTALKRTFSKYGNDAATNKKGIYDGNDSLFEIITKQYMKSALPAFFTLKKNKQ